MKNDFILIFISPLALLVALETFFFWPAFFVWSILLATIIIASSVKMIAGGRLFSPSFYLGIALPILFSVSLSAYSLLLSKRAIVQVLIISSAIFFFYYLKNINKENNERFIENISSYGGFLVVFAFFSFLYGIRTFLGVPILDLVFGGVCVSAILTAQIFWANRIKLSVSMPYLLITCLIMVQLSWSLYFLPLGHNFLGLILAICYYMTIGIIKPSLRGALSKKTVKLYLICGLSSISALLLAAKWI